MDVAYRTCSSQFLTIVSSPQDYIPKLRKHLSSTRYARTRTVHYHVTHYVTRWKVLGIVRVICCYRLSPPDVSSVVKSLEFSPIRHDRLCEGCLVLNK
jgi:hypothetical protein